MKKVILAALLLPVSLAGFAQDGQALEAKREELRTNAQSVQSHQAAVAENRQQIVQDVQAARNYSGPNGELVQRAAQKRYKQDVSAYKTSRINRQGAASAFERR